MDDNTKKQYELIEQLGSICEELGWVVGVPSDGDDGTPVSGLIIGEETFVYQVVSAFTNDYELFTKGPGDEIQELIPTTKKDKKLLH